MCTRDWQRHDNLRVTETPIVLDGGYVVRLGADGTFRRTFIACACAERSAPASEAVGRWSARPWYRRWGSNPHGLAPIGV